MRERERERDRERERRSGCAGWSIFKQGLRSIFKGGARLIGSQQWSICKEGVSLIGEKIDFFDREKKRSPAQPESSKASPLELLGLSSGPFAKKE